MNKIKKRLRNLLMEESFNPTWKSIFINSSYFSRKGLLRYINNSKKYMKGVCLDFGCGTQPYKKLFKCKKYIAIDYPQTRSKSDKNIIWYDGKHIPLKNNCIDCILTTEVMEHIPNLDEILKECNRVLKNEGHIIITIPFLFPEHENPYDFRRFTNEGIKMLLEKHGFKIVILEKTSTYIEMIFQLIQVYINKYLRFGKFNYLIIAIVNIMGILLNKILPKNYDGYINNFIIAKKYL
ncbi:MAG: hypothetical protein ATN32_07355 [Candidatus Epulonipiscium fishelsonii]|nr:MAG: hypothetical protein ATN32_07355 [Epulopiscium sp. AS2M-Bin002]